MLIKSLRDAGIEVSEAEALKYIKGFKKAYPAISRYLSEISDVGNRKLEVWNKAGRLFKFEYPKDNYERGMIDRESKNLPIQGLCADMLKIVMSNLFLKLEHLGVKFFSTVHDELVFECLESKPRKLRK